MNTGHEKAFAGHHPLTLFIYFSLIIIISMFTVHPAILMCSLTGGVSFYISVSGIRNFITELSFYIPLFLLITITNPLFSHNGVTPLFFLNGNAVTLEAILYGADIAIMLISVIFWCKCFNKVVSNDKIIYLFGGLIPKLSIVISMILRFIPLFKIQKERISQSQKAMGFYSSGSYIDRLKSMIRVFSSLITWSLESSIETANSMKARGYGLKGRSNFSMFRFSLEDVVTLSASVLFSVLVFYGNFSGRTLFTFYPEISGIATDLFSIITYVSFGLFCLLPTFTEIKENLKWKYYVSKI